MIKIIESYETEVPDTLDLAERANLAVNALIGLNRRGETYQPNHCSFFYRNPPVLSNDPGGAGYVFDGGDEMWGKYLDALLQMRLASGCTRELELDQKSLSGMLSYMDDDDVIRSITSFIEDGKLVPGGAFHNISNGGRIIMALVNKYELTGDPELFEHTRRIVAGLSNYAIHKDDYAYYPDERVGGGISIPRSGFTHDDEPGGDSFFEYGYHGSASSTVFSIGSLIQGFCRWYMVSGDEKTLDLAGRLVRFIMKERFWKPECDPQAVVSAEHAHFEGHMHSNCRGFMGILDYGILTNDETLKLFVRDGYEYIRTFGIARIGLFGETCVTGDMTALAVKLSDAGVGDYWEDVDQYIRNHLTEVQVLDENDARYVAENAPDMPVLPWEETEDFYQRSIGSLCDDASHPVKATLGYNFCCSFNGYNGFYHAWESIVRYSDGIAQINLLLNRASQWLDIESYEPFEGKVVIRNKKAERISVRIPRFAALCGVSAKVGGVPVKTSYLGRYLVIDNVKPGDVIELCYPLPESEATYTIGWTGVHIPGWTEITRPHVQEGEPQSNCLVASRHFSGREREIVSCRFKGNTAIDIDFNDDRPGLCLYKRDDFKQSIAPMKTVRRDIPEKIIDLRTNAK